MGSETNPSNIGGGVLVTHFWKLFAVVVLALVAWAAYENRRTWNSFRVTTESSGSSFRPWTDFLYHGSLTGLSAEQEQVKPAVVALKDKSGSVEGYVHSADQEFLRLITVYKDKAEIETVLIPWENVLYIRMTGKDRPDRKK